MRSSSRTAPRTAFIGAGRLARALIPALHASGYPVMAIADSKPSAARRAALLAPGSQAVASPAHAAAAADLLLLAVPDGAIREVAGELGSAGNIVWRGKVVLHHAGALGPEVLAPLRRLGADVGVLHPLQSLGDSRLAGGLLAGSSARIEGTPKAMRAARLLAARTGLVPIKLRSPLSPEERRLYHAAASMASNDLIALLDAASGVLETLGLSRRAALAALAPLARGSLLQAEAKGLRAALTGPVARGDADTLSAHLRALGKRRRGSERIHRLLSSRLLRLAEREGVGYEDEALRSLKKLLSAGDTGRRKAGKL